MSWEQYAHMSGWQDCAAWCIDVIKRRRPEPGLIVDLGMDFGFSTFTFAGTFPKSKVIGVDSYGFRSRPHAGQEGRKAKAVVVSNAGRFLNLETVFTTTYDAAVLLHERRARVGVLHIDADHRYGSVVSDWQLFRPLLDPGSLVFLHDIRSAPEGPGRFFKELAATGEFHSMLESKSKCGLAMLAIEE